MYTSLKHTSTIKPKHYRALSAKAFMCFGTIIQSERVVLMMMMSLFLSAILFALILLYSNNNNNNNIFILHLNIIVTGQQISSLR